MADPVMTAKRKRKSPRGPAFTAHIVGHEVLQEDPLKVELIETGGPAHTGAILSYLHRHFPSTKWGSFGGGLTTTACEAVPRSEPIDMEQLGHDFWAVSKGLAEAKDGLNAVLRKVEIQMLEDWPDQTAVTLVEVWEGYTHHLIWDDGLFIDTSEPDKDPRRRPLTSSTCRLRMLAVDELSTLQEQLDG